MNAVTWIENFYGPGAHQPMYYSRTQEIVGLRGYAKHYAIEFTDDEFDIAVANRFNSGCEFEWERV